ncbi:16S rRNA pseudouridine(516) synthase [Methylobacillus gramineus]|uniref:pseudouridine synthase n=1 Tax=Methylobacillus gramineus TaxID=755169 RepID=UPI001CFFD361|nr:16S rRNA pseudouridine(516) synthase [Methylobacillus gramineus]MCB5183932.1 16S rRNA pseudouridine(516) synthase [Methylobacillus gramineus]
MQLERILHSQGFGSRKICRGLIRHGHVSVNGEVCDQPFTEFETENLQFNVRGEDWQFRTQAYLMLHKPAHYECSHKPQHHPSIFSLLPPELMERGVQCIGRLDEDTTGLLMLSDDGQFIHRMSSPKWKVPKIYEVTTKHAVDAEQINTLMTGVQLLDEPAPIAALACELISENVLHLTLAEGKYHQVKRMLAAVSNRVEGLKRIRIGQLELPDDLAPGEWRWLDDVMLERIAPTRNNS